MRDTVADHCFAPIGYAGERRASFHRTGMCGARVGALVDLTGR